jgi:sensor histidine kinase regulating citrate/malate metabolism
MSEIDIYTFLTNALDNAIEATSLIEEKDKRNITINVLKVGEMAKIRVENSFKVKPVFVSGMPITTKSYKKYHGFGVQSMKTTIKKYNGYFNIFVKDEKFVLSATIPL